jgi:hypothetical protein
MTVAKKPTKPKKMGKGKAMPKGKKPGRSMKGRKEAAEDQKGM